MTEPKIPSDIVMSRDEYVTRTHLKNAEQLLFNFYFALRDQPDDIWEENRFRVVASSRSHPEVQRMVRQHLRDNGWEAIQDYDPAAREGRHGPTRVIVRRPNETY